MKLKILVTALIVFAAAFAVESPASMLAVDISRAGLLEQLAAQGARTYGRTEHFLLAAGSGHGLPATSILLSRALPSYLVYVRSEEQAATIARVATVLLRDGRMLLMQLDAATAARVRLLGGELVRLPEKPYPVYLAPRRTYPRTALSDTFIQRIIARVNQDSIRSQILRLQNFRTRYSSTDSCRSAEQYVADYFTWLGMDSVALDTYIVEGDTWRNPIGIRRGRVTPEKIVIICGHMDDYSEDPENYAPGAEDNASGTVMALEAARILVHENFDMTVMFIGFTGEEEGIWGSYYFAGKMRAMGADIVAALNFDMIAWPGGAFGVTIFTDSASLGLAEFEAGMADAYTTLDYAVINGSYGSDQLAFQYYGYASTAGAEYGNFYPYYHTTGDTIGNLSMPLAAEVAKMGIAALATLASAPAPPGEFTLNDAGSGGMLHAAWQPSPSPDVAGYKLRWGTVSRTYTDSAALGRVTSHNITALQNGTSYYATVIAIDSGGHEGYPAAEQSAVPGTTPLPPADVIALPFGYGVATFWHPNAELDLAGYNVYRSTISGSGYVRVNSVLVTDTTYRDSGLMSDTTYYYVATAVDTSDNESNRSSEVRGKPVTLDHGVLLVDETRDGTGQPGSPSDAQQDAFYHMLLHGARYTDWNVATDSVPLAADFGPYSTIVWHADDYAQQRIEPALPGLANHLANGGRLWYVGWKPIVGLYGGGNSHYPYTFAPGDFAWDDLHLNAAGESPTNSYTGASGLLGYPALDCDSAKMYPTQHGRMTAIDIFYPRDAEVVLTFNSATGDSFQDKPVGVRWLADPGRVVFFGFPLYYMNDNAARQAALKVLQDLGEPIGVAENRSSPAAQRLSLDVRPNPCRGRAVFHISAPSSLLSSLASLSLYDPSGRLVFNSSLVTRNSSFSLDLRSLSAGLYFCRLETGTQSFTTKLEVAR